MNRQFFALLPFLAFLFSCQSNAKAYTDFLNKDSLPSQFITIDNTRDTSVKTANWCCPDYPEWQLFF